jgi:hypothetical protein
MNDICENYAVNIKESGVSTRSCDRWLQSNRSMKMTITESRHRFVIIVL